MTTAIFREARKGGGSSKTGKNTTNQVSTLEHLLNKQEYNNSNIKHNSNKFNENTLIYFDSKKNEFVTNKNVNYISLRHKCITYKPRVVISFTSNI